MGIYAVTGAASGIGQAVVEQLKAGGNEVITIDIHDADINADLSESDQVRSAIEAILAGAPDGLDGFVPCAGLGPEFGDKTKIPRVNFFAVVDMVNGLRAALKNRAGVVVLISSNSSQMMEYNADYIAALLDDKRDEAVEIAGTVDGQTLYGGGKQALSRWMRRVNPEFAADGIRMNAVAPGYTESGMTRAGLEDPEFGQAIRDFVNSIPIGRPGLPEDQANAVMFLLSDKADFIAGSVLFVDGGHDAVFRPDKY
jgi:NAD(P)-dependent dehydrogenase (short-subunit alcohol dehydrogenase family)